MKTRIKVIEVVQKGIVGYVKGNSCLDSDAIVANPIDAINFMNEPESPFARRHGTTYDPDDAAKYAMSNLRLKEDAWFAKSGLLVESACIVDFEFELTEVSRSNPRVPHGNMS